MVIDTTKVLVVSYLPSMSILSQNTGWFAQCRITTMAMCMCMRVFRREELMTS